MKTSVENKVLLGFIGTFLVLIITGWLLFRNNRNLASSAGMVSHTNEVLYNISGLQVLITDFESRARGAVLSEDHHFEEANEAKAAEIAQSLASLKMLTRDNAFQQKQVDTLAGLTAQKIRFMRSVLGALSLQGFGPAKDMIASGQGALMMEKINRKLSDMSAHEQQLFVIREKKHEAQSLRNRWLYAGLLAVVATILVCVYMIMRNNFAARSRNEDSILRLNQALEQHVAQLETANKDLESFSYSVSHDLRAPLRAINGYAQILSQEHSDKFDAEATRLMAVVTNNAKKMGQLIDDLLAFSRLGRKDIVKHHVVMNQLVNDVVQELKRHQEANGMELDMADLPEVYGDKSMLKQVWMNLISNAIKYTRDGVKPVIKISAYKEKDSFVYCIADNGVGFDMSFYNKLFGVFQRLHNADEFEGTGVGLAIVKRIVHKHNGEIWAEAKVNAGAKFCFSIPN